MLYTVLVTDGHSLQAWGVRNEDAPEPRDDGSAEAVVAAAGDAWRPGEGGRAP